jgi:hypothetical protein
MTPGTDKVSRWLLDGDPTIRWQALRDVVGAAEHLVERERQGVAREGWGARLLARQDREGTWAGGLSSDGGLYHPKWISTTYTMLLLRDFGLPATNRQARKACALLLDHGLQRDGGINYGWTPSETCVTGMVLSILSSFAYDDDRLDTVADHLLGQQMPDGGWNCQRRFGATHASVHTTISVLEGLRHYELHRRRKVGVVRAAQRRGREFLLVHRLFRSHRTGAVIKPIFLRFSFPPRWHYDILRRSITSRPRARPAIRASPRRLTSSEPRGATMAAGRFKTASRARLTSSWNDWARPAAGTPSGRYGY